MANAGGEYQYLTGIYLTRIFHPMSDLSEYLEQHRIRQEDFALTIGVTQATVSRLARGAMRPGLDLALVIEKATAGKVSVSSWASPRPPEDAAASCGGASLE